MDADNDLILYACIYGSVSAGREKWPFNVLFFLKVEFWSLGVEAIGDDDDLSHV